MIHSFGFVEAGGEQGAERGAFSEPLHAFCREDSGLVKELGNGMQGQAYLSRKYLGQIANSIYDIAFHLFLQALTGNMCLRGVSIDGMVYLAGIQVRLVCV